MYCPICKTPNPAWNEKCSECGHDMTKVKNPDDPTLYFIGSIALGLFSLLMVYLVFFKKAAHGNLPTSAGGGVGMCIGGTYLLYKKYKSTKGRPNSR